jgi:DNA-directed RNA polymerase specialized sigma24 family protein
MSVKTAGSSLTFTEFFERSERRLRRALVASYGPAIGRESALDAMSWGWEHWAQLQVMDNPIGYLYRVGQSAARRLLKSPPAVGIEMAATDDPEIAPELAPALARLSEQQRAAVVLVHGYAMSQRHAAEVLGISVSTLREHLGRGMERLRNDLKDRDHA